MGTSSLLSGSGIVTSAKKLLQNQSNFIFNGILIVITMSGESTFSALAFNCPCAYPQNIYYGGAFLFVPAVSLFFVGILVNSTTWKIVHGCFYRSRKTWHGLKRSVYYWISVLVQAVVAPLAWLFVAYLNGEYYICLYAAEANSCQLAATKNKTAMENLETKVGSEVAKQISYGGSIDPECICNLPNLDKKRLQAHSQIIAWYILLASVSLALAINLVLRCMDRFTYRQNYYFNLYRQVEESKFEEIAKERAKTLATANWNNFFDKKDRKKLDWDEISTVPLSDFPHFLKTSSLKAISDPAFSPLDRWTKNQKVRSVDSDNILVPVDKVEAKKSATVGEDLESLIELKPKKANFTV